MRFPALLLAVVFAIPLLSYASDPTPKVDESQQANLQSQSADETAPSDVKSWRFPLRRSLQDRYDEVVCYTVRSYIMQREEWGSDVTRPVKYRTCEPSWKFEFRSAGAQRER